MFEYPNSLTSPFEKVAIVVSTIVIVAMVIAQVFVVVAMSRRKAKRSDFWVTISFITVWGFAIWASFETPLEHLTGIVSFLSFCLLFFALIGTLIGYLLEKMYSMFCVQLIVMVLLALLMLSIPFNHFPRKAYDRTVCANNMKQIALSIHDSFDVNDRFPSLYGDPKSDHPVSWRVQVLPFLEQNRLFDTYDQNKAWNSGANAPLAKSNIEVYTCPSNPFPKDSNGRVFSAYSIPDGSHTFFGKNQIRRFDDATAGTSNTFFLVEACGQNIIWTEPRDVNVDEVPIGFNLPGKNRHESNGLASGLHSGGFNSARLDGAVDFISADTDPDVLRQMIKGTE